MYKELVEHYQACANRTKSRLNKTYLNIIEIIKTPILLHIDMMKIIAKVSIFIAGIYATPYAYQMDIFQATVAGNHDAVLKIITQDPSQVNHQNQLGLTPLHIAAHKGYSLIARTLLEHHAPVDTQDFLGETPLHTAASSGGAADIVSMLIAYKAHVNTHNNNGLTPLHKAVIHTHDNIMQLLVNHKAN